MKIIPVFLKYAYGKKERGESTEKLIFLPALEENADEVIPFWLEDNGYPEDQKGLQKRLLDFIDQINPDMVFFMLMRDEVTIETIERLNKKYITVNWFCDDQWRFETFTKYIAPKLKYSITVDKYSIPKYKQIGCDNVILSQWATFEYVKNIDFSNICYKYDISFIGAKNPIRVWYVNELERMGYKVDCFGYGWDRGLVSFERMKDIFLSSKINLNLSNSLSYDIRFRNFIKHSLYKNFIQLKFKSYIEMLKILRRYFLISKSHKRLEQIKMRNFEIPACGGFQLGHYAPSIEDYFVFGREIAVYSNIDELKKQVEYYLGNEKERKKIMIAGYLKAKQYTFNKRFKEIFDKISL